MTARQFRRLEARFASVRRAIHQATRRYRSDRSGVAAAEVVLWLAVLAPVLFNIVDLGLYVFQRLQVRNAAQMGAQAAWANCPSPPSSGCTGFTTAIDNAIRSTSLGSSVSRIALTEGYRCRDVNTMALGASSSSPPTCSSGGPPGYYVRIQVRFRYNPGITGVSLASLLTGNVDEVAWTRLK